MIRTTVNGYKQGELVHYGMKGMKWGIRNKTPNPKSEDYKKSKEVRSKRINQMSNDELNLVTKRLNLETRFQEAKSKRHPSPVKRGLDFWKTATALGAAAAGAYKFAKSPAGQKIQKALFKNMKKPKRKTNRGFVSVSSFPDFVI